MRLSELESAAAAALEPVTEDWSAMDAEVALLSDSVALEVIVDKVV